MLPTSAGTDTDGNAAVPPSGAPGAPAFNQQVSNFVHGSGPIYTMYLEKAEKEEEKMAESCRGDVDGILVFVRPHAPLRTLLHLMTILLPGLVFSLLPLQHSSRLYFRVSPGTLRIPRPSTLHAPTHSWRERNVPSPFLPFSPSPSAIWVNIPLFLSLVVGLTCAPLAMILQQWVCRYLRLTRPPKVPHKRARIRASLRVDKLYIPVVVETLPGLPHVPASLPLLALPCSCVTTVPTTHRFWRLPGVASRWPKGSLHVFETVL
ncbi:hypothetical protein BC834DRAFT_898650 [Gloeopeniophorella convolvens]|nr:hypothetical protein BC834DRAFT_898650 [Gloeopeniophorella convolvens]